MNKEGKGKGGKYKEGEIMGEKGKRFWGKLWNGISAFTNIMEYTNHISTSIFIINEAFLYLGELTERNG